MNGIFRAAHVASSGLKANRGWMNIISNNLANMHSADTGIRDGEGNFVPYSRQVPVFAKVLSDQFRRSKLNGNVVNGVEVKKVASLDEDVRKVYDPAHPAARKEGKDVGYVYMPNISTAQEMADMRMAAASYEANLSVLAVSKQMTEQALALSRRG